MARARDRNDIYFNTTDYDEAAQLVRERVRQENQSCHHGQCRGVTKAAKRCSRCLNERVASSAEKLCHSHVGTEQFYRLTRQARPVVGYDPQLHRNKNAWLADDGMETAIRILHSQIKAKKFAVDFIGRDKRALYNYTVNGDVTSKLVCILLQHNHWFVMTTYKRFSRGSSTTRGRRSTWWLLDSMPRSPLEVQRIQRDLETTLIPAHYDGLRCNVILADSLIQQNQNDCGFFAINNIVELVTGQPLATTSDMVRHKVLLFLAGRGN